MIDHLFSAYQGKKVVVTGGAGFIGSHIVHALVHYGARVTVLDNLSTGSLDNIASLQHALTFIHGSVTDQKTVHSALKNQEMLFHLAALTSVPLAEQDPLLCYNINVQGTAQLLQAASDAQMQACVFSSSAAVYGAQSEACREDMTVHPHSVYGLSKLLGEEICAFYASQKKVSTICLRYFNVFGDRQKTSGPSAGIVSIMKDALEHNKPFCFYGDGSQTRDFVAVEDVVKANLTAGLCAPRIHHGIYNVATGISTSLYNLFASLKAQYPLYNHEPHYAPVRAGDIHYSGANIARLHELYRSFTRLYTDKQF